MIKKLSVMFLTIFLIGQFGIAVTTLGATEINNEEAFYYDSSNDKFYLDGIELTEHNIDYLIDEEQIVTTVNDVNESGQRSVAALYAGSMFVPGVGQVVITTTGVILLAGVTIKASSWLGTKITNYFAAQSQKKAADSVSTSIKSSRYYVNLKLCKDNYGNTASKKKTGNFNCGKKWSLKKDTAKHGGSNWKVYYNGVRKASIDKNGKILRG